MKNDTPTSLYLYYDRRDVLLYIGITNRGMQRNTEHNQSKDWWPFVSRQAIRHYNTRDDAKDAERALIKLHRPPFNVQHNPDHPVLAAAYLRYNDLPVATHDDVPVRCAVCSNEVADAVAVFVDYDEVKRVIQHNSLVSKAEETEAHMQALKALDEVLAVVRNTDDPMLAMSRVAELLQIEERWATSFVKRPIIHLCGFTREGIADDYAATCGMGNPEIARWQIAHPKCVVDQPARYLFTQMPAPHELITATADISHDWSDWIKNTDWRTFSKKLALRWSDAS